MNTYCRYGPDLDEIQKRNKNKMELSRLRDWIKYKADYNILKKVIGKTIATFDANNAELDELEAIESIYMEYLKE